MEAAGGREQRTSAQALGQFLFCGELGGYADLEKKVRLPSLQSLEKQLEATRAAQSLLSKQVRSTPLLRVPALPPLPRSSSRGEPFRGHEWREAREAPKAREVPSAPPPKEVKAQASRDAPGPQELPGARVKRSELREPRELRKAPRQAGQEQVVFRSQEVAETCETREIRGGGGGAGGQKTERNRGTIPSSTAESTQSEGARASEAKSKGDFSGTGIQRGSADQGS